MPARSAKVAKVCQFLVSLIGLGVAIEYSLLLVTRWREERHRGHETLPCPAFRGRGAADETPEDPFADR
jgi:uncharacterized membrane protein YdfJ with MMPL/SSD domain